MLFDGPLSRAAAAWVAAGARPDLLPAPRLDLLPAWISLPRPAGAATYLRHAGLERRPAMARALLAAPPTRARRPARLQRRRYRRKGEIQVACFEDGANLDMDLKFISSLETLD